jgi:hypothetical protein
MPINAQNIGDPPHGSGFLLRGPVKPEPGACAARTASGGLQSIRERARIYHFGCALPRNM